MLKEIVAITAPFLVAHLLTKKPGGSIGKIYESESEKNLIQCRNGKFSDSVAPGSCSSNGGIDLESEFKEFFLWSMGHDAEDVTVRKNKVKVYFKRSLKQLGRIQDSRPIQFRTKRISYKENKQGDNKDLTVNFEFNTQKDIRDLILLAKRYRRR
jgi:hypothetical protein